MYITEFRGDNRWLSNFWPCPVDLFGIRFPSAEHAFQAAKTHDKGARLAIAGLKTPGEAKRAGRSLQLRPDWPAARKRTMLGVVLVKFSQNPELGWRLIATEGSQLVEGNTWGDDYWGAVALDGRRETDDRPVWSSPGGYLYGQNYLGRILMMARDIVRED